MNGPDMPSPRLLTVEEVRQRLNVSVSTVRKMVRERKLVPVRLCRRLTFDARDVDALITAMKH
jgi:excisionase family DNA binding protein